MLDNAQIAEDIEKMVEYIGRQDIAKSAEASRLAHLILDEILAFVKPGVRESEVKNFAFSRYEAHAIERPWHMPYIRFGEHTLLNYKQKAKEDLVLQDNDIAFADIGTVKNGYEGDAGRTIAFGSNKELQRLADTSKILFDEMTAYWRNNRPTGQQLYDMTYEATKKHGFVFNLDGAGHLIGEFPHKGWKHGMSNFPNVIEDGGWVLEIQIRHPTLAYGAFFEDLLH